MGAVGAGDDRCHEASQYETVVARVAACRLQYSGVAQHLSVFSCINELSVSYSSTDSHVRQLSNATRCLLQNIVAHGPVCPLYLCCKAHCGRF